MKSFSYLIAILLLVVGSFSFYHFQKRERNKFPIIVLHGGPGLSSSYIKEHLTDFENRHFVFFDQKNCDDLKCANGVPKFDELVDQLKAQVEKIDGPFGILAHSWGSTLLLKFLETYPNLKPSEVLLTNIFLL